MPEFTYAFKQFAGHFVTIEAESREAGEDAAWEKLPVSLCHQCAHEYDMAGDWELDEEAVEEVPNDQALIAKMSRELDLAHARIAELEQQAEPLPGYPMAIAEFDDWLRNGHRGLSSEAMVYALTGNVTLPGKPVHVGHSCPGDAGDFRRCENLLRAVPEARNHLERVAALGPQWAALVEHWDELAAIGDRSTLYRRIQELIRESIGRGAVSDR